MKINKKIAQIGLLMVITGLAFGMITYVNQSACAIAFHQPVPPVNIQKNFKLEDLIMKNFAKCFSIERVMGVIASLALLIGISSMSQACFLTFNQPKVPQGLDKFRNEK